MNKRINARLATLAAKTLTKQSMLSAAKHVGPLVLAAALSPLSAHAQGTIDFGGATTLMTSFKTFAIYAGAIICFGGLIFAGIQMIAGRFQESIPGLFGALFGAGVLGWGAGWISSLTGQSVTTILLNHNLLS